MKCLVCSGPYPSSDHRCARDPLPAPVGGDEWSKMSLKQKTEHIQKLPSYWREMCEMLFEECRLADAEVERLTHARAQDAELIERARRLLGYALDGHINDGDIEVWLADFEKRKG